MRRVFLFINVSLDGYFEMPGHDISGFKRDNEAFDSGGGNEVDTLLFGHTTYEGMKFWATPQAAEMMPDIAKFMNATPKYVASRQNFDPGWDKVTVIHDAVADVKKLKAQPGKTIMIMGSSNLCVSLMQAGLIDDFQVVVNPVVFGAGTTLFDGLPGKADLTLTSSHPFKSGAVLLTYVPEKKQA
jgi:dihydrofolate reductase